MMLEESELLKPRKIEDAFLWVHLQIERIAALPQGDSIIRLRKGNTKKLIEEYLPLASYAKWKFDGQPFECRLTPHGESDDAYVQKSDGTIIESIQITQASLNEQEFLRYKLLMEEGVVPATGRIEVEEKDGQKRLVARRAARSHDSLIAETTDEIVKAIRKKGKHRDIDVLIIEYEFHHSAQLANSVTEIAKGVQERLNGELGNFRNIYLVEFGGDVQKIR